MVDFSAQRRMRGSHRRESVLILAVSIAALSMTMVASASASSNNVIAWGENSLGQLGNGTTTNSDVPVAVSGLSGVTAVDAGGGVSLALLGDGTVMAWGGNELGTLGDGTTTNSDVPVKVSGLSGVTAISAGKGDHSLALLSNGTVVAWGDNAYGQLGDGTTTSSDVPVAVSGLSGVTAISAGALHSLALLANGTVMAWGLGANGQVGDGAREGSSTPVHVCAVGTAGPCPSGPN
jgi:alpha-tubulin suppressor-like RCC1 family protein